MARTELMAASWSASIEDLRERLLTPADLSATLNQPAGIAVSLGLSLVGDTYRSSPTRILLGAHAWPGRWALRLLLPGWPATCIRCSRSSPPMRSVTTVVCG